VLLESTGGFDSTDAFEECVARMAQEGFDVSLNYKLDKELALLLCPPPSTDRHPFWMSEPGNCAMKTKLGSTNSKGLQLCLSSLSIMFISACHAQTSN